MKLKHLLHSTIKISGFSALALFSFNVSAKSLKQATAHDYVTERYYLGLDSNRAIEEKMTRARLRGDEREQIRVLCVDVRKYYQDVIALNQANRHFNPKKIDAETKEYRVLLKGLDKENVCKDLGF